MVIPRTWIRKEVVFHSCYHDGQNYYIPAFFISTSNIGKKTRILQKTPEFRENGHNDFPVWINFGFFFLMHGDKHRWCVKHDDQHCTLIARLRHLARREVSVQVGARRLREHEVVRGMVGAHPPVGPDHLRHVGSRCAVVGARPALWQPSRKTHWSRHTCCSVSAFWFVPQSQVGRWPRLRPAAWCVFPLARAAAATRRILGWSPRSSLMLVCLSFPQSTTVALCFFLVSVVNRLKMNLHCFWFWVFASWIFCATWSAWRTRTRGTTTPLPWFGGAMNDWCDQAHSAAVAGHDVCQVQDSCGSQGARVVKSGTGSLVREPPTQSHSHFCLYLSCQVFVLWDMFFVQMICCSSVYPKCV